MLLRSIHKGNPTLSTEMIEELGDLWGKSMEDGTWMLKGDHRHRYTNPVRYNWEDMQLIWKGVTARAGLVMATKSTMYQRFGEAGRIDEARELLRIRPEHYYEIADCHHMLHLEKPQETAAAILDFFSA